jgi:hypothetical protein
MENSKLNQTLVELEENLKKIESARFQVNNVAEKSQLLISTFNALIKQLEVLPNHFDIDKEGMLGSINKNVIKFDKDVNEKTSKYSELIDNQSALLKLRADEVVDKLQVLQNEILNQIEILKEIGYDDKLSEIIHGLTKISSDLMHFIQDSKKTFDSFDNKISIVLKKQDDNQELIISTLNYLFNGLENKLYDIKSEISIFEQNLNKQLESLLFQIKEIGSELLMIKVSIFEVKADVNSINNLIVAENKQLSSNLDALQKIIKRQSLWNKIFIIIGFLGLILFELLLKAGVFNWLISFLR